MISVIVGREATTSQLLLSSGRQSTSFGARGSVPKSVSREHCLLTIEDDQQTMTLTNQNANNVTFVNGMQIVTCKVSFSDVVELGREHYPLNWQAVRELMAATMKKKPEEVDITHLEKVWEEYKHNDEQLTKKVKMAGLLRSIGIGLGMVAGAVGAWAKFLAGVDFSMGILIASAVSAIIIALTIIISYVDMQGVPKKREELKKELLHSYCCPKCGYYFGKDKSYDIIKANIDSCPKCKSKFIK